MIPDSDISRALDALKRERVPQQVMIATSMPGRRQRVELTLRDGESVLIQTVVGNAPSGFEPPELAAITFFGSNPLRAACVMPLDTDEELLVALVRYLAERADWVEFQLSRGADEH